MPSSAVTRSLPGWRVDKEAVRNTKDVNILIRRTDLQQMIDALQAVGFVHQYVNGI